MPSGYLPTTYHCFINGVTLLLQIISRYLTRMPFLSSPSGEILTYSSEGTSNIFPSVNPLDRINCYPICDTEVLFILYYDFTIICHFLQLWDQSKQRLYLTHFYIPPLSLAQGLEYVYSKDVWQMNSTL